MVVWLLTTNIIETVLEQASEFWPEDRAVEEAVSTALTSAAKVVLYWEHHLIINLTGLLTLRVV